MPTVPLVVIPKTLPLRLARMADAEGWDLNGLRDRLGEDVTEYARELPLVGVGAV
jgi:hypothetical protein